MQARPMPWVMSLHAITFEGRVSRREIALMPAIWRALPLSFGLFALCQFGAAFVVPGLDRPRMLAFGVALVVATVILAVMRRPVPGSRAVHGVLALTWLGCAGAVWAFAPHGAAAIPVAMFIGPLVAVWVVDRRQIAAHYLLATIALAVASTTGGADGGTLVAAIVLIPAIWALGLCVVVVMELAEAEGDQLERLTRRDPLTGAGNRRDLDTKLRMELETHLRTGEPLSVLTLDLNGFKALNDTAGHAAGDALLRAVVRTLEASVRPQDTVVRQGGDEFCVVLPGRSDDEAAAVATRLHRALAHATATGGVTTGIGAATFPQDGETVVELLAAADRRLLDDKRRASAMRSHGPQAAVATTRPKRTQPRPMAPTARRAGPPVAAHRIHRRSGLSRTDLARNRFVWIAGSSTYLYYAFVGAGVTLWTDLGGAAFPFVVAVGGLIGIGLMLSSPAAIGTRRNHLVVACTYLVPFAILLSCAPEGSTGVGTAIFIGPLAAMRLVERRQIAAHYAVVTVLFLGLAVSGQASPTTIVSILLLLIALWVLGACCVTVLEAAEAQAKALEGLVRRDPLTGAGNRRALRERLDLELARHARTGRTFAVLALDLDGFKALNDTHGHAAGDQLLRHAAEAIGEATGPHDLVVRQGGDEFCVVLPDTSLSGARGASQLIRRCLERVQLGGTGLTSGFGIAMYPADGATTDVLLGAADADLLAAKQARRDQLRIAAGRERSVA